MFKFSCKVCINVVNTVGHKQTLTNNTSSKLWHKRLGYIFKEKMQRLTRDQILPSLNYGDFEICINCIKGKMTNKKNKGSTRSSKLLKLIHTEICGIFPKLLELVHTNRHMWSLSNANTKWIQVIHHFYRLLF